MRILAIDTSTRFGSVALLKQAVVVRQTNLPESQRTAQALAPAMQQLLEDAGWTPGSIQLVALTNGPGSFTGLRIAVTAGKTFAYACGAKVLALNTLDVIVHQLPLSIQRACAVVNAQRGQWFAGIYRRDPQGRWVAVQPCHLVDRQPLVDCLEPGTLLTGPAAGKLPPSVPEHLRQADPACWVPRAETVGQLAWHAHQAGRRDDLWQLAPRYYRPSYAEETRSEKTPPG